MAICPIPIPGLLWEQFAYYKKRAKGVRHGGLFFIGIRERSFKTKACFKCMGTWCIIDVNFKVKGESVMRKAIILAAGEGTRMKSKYSKALFSILNKPIIQYVTDVIKEAGIEEYILIAGKNLEDLKNLYGDEARYAVQEIGPGKPYGTGYAAKLGLDFIQDEDSVLILCADAPLFQPEGLKALMNHREKNKEAARCYAARLENHFRYGRMIYKGDKLIKIVEEKDADQEEKKVNLVNSGVHAFEGKALKFALGKLSVDNAQGEYYLTDAIEILLKQGEKVGLDVLKDSSEMMGVNSKVQLAQVENILRKRVNEEYMLQGVILENPDRIFIQPGVVIGRDTRIEAGCRITGETVIGEDSSIESGSIISNCRIGNNVRIRQSVLEDSVLEDNVDIGPFAHLRPKAYLKKKVHVGNFVEVKNATMGEGAKAGHLAYIGDAELKGDNNIGCGVIFVNYDGKNKHRSVVEKGAFIGSNANIVAPVHIGEDAYIAAGSTITKDVEKKALALERSEQKIVMDWVERKR